MIYSRQARNIDNEKGAIEIRIRAERRCGKLLAHKERRRLEAAISIRSGRTLKRSSIACRRRAGRCGRCGDRRRIAAPIHRRNWWYWTRHRWQSARSAGSGSLQGSAHAVADVLAAYRCGHQISVGTGWYRLGRTVAVLHCGEEAIKTSPSGDRCPPQSRHSGHSVGRASAAIRGDPLKTNPPE